MLAEEAMDDLQKLGLQLDTLKIRHVSDDRQYLESIGRERIARIVRDAEVAESDAIRAAEEAEATENARTGVAQENAHTTIKRKENALRQLKAVLHARARSEDEQAEQGALATRAEAEQELQTIRAELEHKLTIVDESLAGGGNLGAKAVVASEQLKHTTGVDVPALLKRLSGPTPPPLPTA